MAATGQRMLFVKISKSMLSSAEQGRKQHCLGCFKENWGLQLTVILYPGGSRDENLDILGQKGLELLYA